MEPKTDNERASMSASPTHLLSPLIQYINFVQHIWVTKWFESQKEVGIKKSMITMVSTCRLNQKTNTNKVSLSHISISGEKR